MGKRAEDVVLDNGLSYVESNCDQINVNEGEPTTYAEATSGSKFLGSVATTSSDFTIADGDSSGRKVTTSKQSGVSITSGGTWNHISWVNTGSSELLMVTTVAERAVSNGGSVDIPAIDYEVQDPD